MTPDPDKIRAFPSAAAFERWLRAQHDQESEVWLKIHKKGSGLPTVTNAEAIDVALCWGWIDGLRKAFDEHSFLQRFTPRRRKSIWSQINRKHVARLIAEGRMQASGLREIDAAKADGRWDAAYASSREMTVPDDLVAAIRVNPEAQATFKTLSRQNLFAFGFRLGNIKGDAARARRIAAFVALLARGETLYPNARAKPAKTKAARPSAKKKAARPSAKKSAKKRKVSHQK